MYSAARLNPPLARQTFVPPISTARRTWFSSAPRASERPISPSRSLAAATAERGRRIYYGALAALITSLEEAQAAGRLHHRLNVLAHAALLNGNHLTRASPTSGFYATSLRCLLTDGFSVRFSAMFVLAWRQPRESSSLAIWSWGAGSRAPRFRRPPRGTTGRDAPRRRQPTRRWIVSLASGPRVQVELQPPRLQRRFVPGDGPCTQARMARRVLPRPCPDVYPDVKGMLYSHHGNLALMKASSCLVIVVSSCLLVLRLSRGSGEISQPADLGSWHSSSSCGALFLQTKGGRLATRQSPGSRAPATRSTNAELARSPPARLVIHLRRQGQVRPEGTISQCTI